MPKTKKEKADEARKRYNSNAKYREYKKRYRKEYEKNHEAHEEKMSREYYKKHPAYRREKIKKQKLKRKK